MDGIIFDVDGTLWDSTFTAATAWNEAIKEFGNVDVEVTADLLKSPILVYTFTWVRMCYISYEKMNGCEEYER